MSCADWEARVALFAGGDLEDAEAAAVERHLRECAACRGLAADLGEDLNELREGCAAPFSAADYGAVRGRVLAELAKPPRRRAAWAWVGALAAAAAGVWVVSLAVRPGRLPAPQPPSVVARVERPAEAAPGGNRPVAHQARRRLGRKAGTTPGSAGLTAGATTPGFIPLGGSQSPPGAGRALPAGPGLEELAVAQAAPANRAAEASTVRMVQLVTDDPNVVIYWLFDEGTGEER